MTPLSRPSPCRSASCMENVCSVSLSPAVVLDDSKRLAKRSLLRRTGRRGEGRSCRDPWGTSQSPLTRNGAHQDRFSPRPTWPPTPRQPLEAEAEVPGKHSPISFCFHSRFASVPWVLRTRDAGVHLLVPGGSAGAIFCLCESLSSNAVSALLLL